VFVHVPSGKRREFPSVAAHSGLELGTFSPSGRRLSLTWIEDGAVQMGVLDLVTGRLVEAISTPNLMRHEVFAVWLDDDRLAFAAMEDGRQPWGAVGRHWISGRFEKLWARQARGELSVEVH